MGLITSAWCHVSLNLAQLDMPQTLCWLLIGDLIGASPVFGDVGEGTMGFELEN